MFLQGSAEHLYIGFRGLGFRGLGFRVLGFRETSTANALESGTLLCPHIKRVV